MVVDTIGLKKSRVLLKVLLDPGSTNTLISRKALLRGSSLIPLQEVKTYTGIYNIRNPVQFTLVRIAA